MDGVVGFLDKLRKDLRYPVKLFLLRGIVVNVSVVIVLLFVRGVGQIERWIETCGVRYISQGKGRVHHDGVVIALSVRKNGQNAVARIERMRRTYH